MTEEEHHALALLKEQLAQKEQRIQELEGRLVGALLRLEELERRLSKDSHNSSLPPSRNHGKRTPLGTREKSQKPSGGQAGHDGHMLMQVQIPDQVIVHRPLCCEGCSRDLQEEPGKVVERRQVQDLPELRLQVQEHHVEVITCPRCQQLSRGTFPQGVNAPAQYGPRVQAMAVYFSPFQLLPLQRTCEVLSNLCHAPISQGSVRQWITEGAKLLEPSQERLKELMLRSRLQQVDETSVHLTGRVRWIHVNATPWLTLHQWHPKRGAEGIEAVGVMPRFTGRAMHDRWTSSDRYPCTHSLCGAHLIRDALFVAEQEKQPRAQEMVATVKARNHLTPG